MVNIRERQRETNACARGPERGLQAPDSADEDALGRNRL